jgi:hypothetical protein
MIWESMEFYRFEALKMTIKNTQENSNHQRKPLP